MGQTAAYCSDCYNEVARSDTPLRQAGCKVPQPSGRVAPRGLDILFGDRLRRPGYPLLLPVQRVMSRSRFGREQTPREDAVKGVSPQAPRGGNHCSFAMGRDATGAMSRTVMNNVGWGNTVRQPRGSEQPSRGGSVEGKVQWKQVREPDYSQRQLAL